MTEPLPLGALIVLNLGYQSLFKYPGVHGGGKVDISTENFRKTCKFKINKPTASNGKFLQSFTIYCNRWRLGERKIDNLLSNVLFRKNQLKIV